MRLSLRTQKLAISAVTGMCLVSAGVVVAWGFRPPTTPSANCGSESRREEKHAASTQDDSTTAPNKDAFAQLCDRPLRQPLYDPPPPKPEVRQLPPLGVELLGTVLEGENSMAMIRSPQGQVEYRRQGESIGPVDSPAQIVEIQANAILMERADERITLRVQGSEQR